MILKDILECLEQFLTCYVGVQAPSQTSDYVLIDQTGSDTQNHITTSTVVVQCYGASLLDALKLWGKVNPTMLGELIKNPNIAAVKLETDYNYTDVTTKQYRWQAVYHITHYKTAETQEV